MNSTKYEAAVLILTVWAAIRSVCRTDSMLRLPALPISSAASTLMIDVPTAASASVQSSCRRRRCFWRRAPEPLA